MGPFVWELAGRPIRVKVIGPFVWELPGGKRQQSKFFYSEQRTPFEMRVT